MEEDPQNRKSGPVARVEKMFDQLLAKFTRAPEFLLCILPDKKSCDLYGNSFYLYIKCLTSKYFHTYFISSIDM